MKRIITCLLILSCITPALSNVIHTETVESKINGNAYTLFYHFPDLYEEGDQLYPVIYVLNCEWILTSYIQTLKELKLDQKVVLVGIGYGQGPGVKMSNELVDYQVKVEGEKVLLNEFKEVLLTELIPYSISKYPIDQESVNFFGNAETSGFLTSLAFSESGSFNYLVSNLQPDKEFLTALKNSYTHDEVADKSLYLINVSKFKRKYGKNYDAILNSFGGGKDVLKGELFYYETESDFPEYTTSSAFKLGLMNLEFTPKRNTRKISSKVDFEYSIETESLWSDKIKDSFLIYSYCSTLDKDFGKTLIVNLDSDLDFLIQVKVCDSLLQKGLIGDFIVVGAGSGVDLGDYGDKRFRYLMHNKISGYKVSGEGYDYQDFLENEIITYAKNKYGDVQKKILAGHSLGGLFVARAASGESQRFDGYLISSPSFWLEKNGEFKELSNQFSSSHSKAKLYLSVGDGEGKKTKMEANLVLFYQRIQVNQQAPDKVKMEVHKEQDHVSVVPIAFANGMVFLAGH